jgi:hypothetical protein
VAGSPLKGMHGLGDRKRGGRPPRFTPVQQAQVKALACELPAMRGVPLSRWSSAELADEAVTAGVAASISASTVRRWLRRDALKPWQYRSWIAPRAPDFAQRAAVILGLYDGLFDGEPLGEDDPGPLPLPPHPVGVATARRDDLAAVVSLLDLLPPRR